MRVAASTMAASAARLVMPRGKAQLELARGGRRRRRTRGVGAGCGRARAQGVGPIPDRRARRRAGRGRGHGLVLDGGELVTQLGQALLKLVRALVEFGQALWWSCRCGRAATHSGRDLRVSRPKPRRRHRPSRPRLPGHRRSRQPSCAGGGQIDRDPRYDQKPPFRNHCLRPSLGANSSGYGSIELMYRTKERCLTKSRLHSSGVPMSRSLYA